MKHFTIVSLLTLFTFLYIYNINSLRQEENEKSKVKNLKSKLERDLEEKEKSPKKDRPDEAYYLEFLKTKDPATNTIPIERLIEAKRIADERTLSDNTPIPLTWKERGPKNLGGRTRAILVDLNDATRKTIFAGSVGGGLWKTTDITQNEPNWTRIDDFFSNIAISCIAQHPSQPQNIYFGTGEGFYNIDAIRGLGIWKSTNGGSTFFQLSSTNNSNFHYVQKIVIHPITGDIYAATRNSGVMRSQDGGNSWVKVLGVGLGAASDRAADIELSANAIYASTGLLQTDGIYKSFSGNSGSWTKLNNDVNGFPTTGFHRLELATAPNDSNVMYILAQNSVNYGLLGMWKTINAGLTFIPIPTPIDADPLIGNDFTRGQAWYDLICAVDPNNANNLFIGGIDLFKSTTGGAQWQQISHWYGGFTFQDVHADQHAIVFQPGSSSVIYFGNDGGVYRTSEGNLQIPVIKNKETNYNTTQYYACAIHPGLNTTHFLAGAQDNGSHKYNSAGVNSTTEVTGGDGAFVHIDQNQPQFQFTSYVYNNYFRSTDGGNSFAAVDFSDDGQFINPTDYDDTTNIMYCGSTAGNFRRWNNPQTGNSSDVVAVSSFGSNMVTAVKVSLSTRNKVFFGTANGLVVRIDSANTGTSKSGTLISSGLPSAYVSCIELDPANDNHILVTYSNYGVNSIWETTNGGSSWSSVEGNMPDMPIRWIIFSPNNSDHAIAATEIGIWTTDNLDGSATNWGPSNSGFANVSTHMIQYRTSDKMMIAATHGRGLFSSESFSSALADFDANKKVSYKSKSIQFIDNSTQASSWLWNFGDGTTSTAQNPLKTYSNAGNYNVSLMINGNISINKPGFIKIIEDRATPYTLAMGGSFETNPGDFIAENISGTPWQRGSSTVTGKDSTHSGTNAWVTGITQPNYLDGTHAILYTPHYKFTAAGTYTFKFWSKFSTEFAWDGYRVEATTNKGDSWIYIGTVGPNWYNFPNNVQSTVFPVNEPYFSGPQLTWKQFSTSVSSFAGQNSVAFRFVFKTDANTPDIGVAIDDFELEGPPNPILQTGNEISSLPTEFLMNQNYPNPFNPVTEIKFQLPKNELVNVSIFDITGRQIAVLINKDLKAGYHSVSFDGSNLSSGVYFYKLSAGKFNDVKKMLLLK